MSLPQLNKGRSRKGFYAGRIVQLFNDLSIEFSESLLEEILVQYNVGYSPEEIAEYLYREPDEIFLALFHLARQGKEVRPIGSRL